MGAFSVFRLLRTVWTVGVSAQSCRFRVYFADSVRARGGFGTLVPVLRWVARWLCAVLRAGFARCFAGVSFPSTCSGRPMQVTVFSAILVHFADNALTRVGRP
ncbi:hypothetical protein AL08_00595 [Corynebacterium diphtheriae bv. gravis str. ISS 4746]|nr:hypothetical protein B179_11281 [Corynebacterium diphtheriae str. Aberdeen]KLN43463.1 hypothetical protein AL08_00595 [Corynebacterium diphtheriae bv. gravis str. ISS 4746]KLN45466.1 hypothetical protein AL09_00025 [Corynebacterium diphtheriae bv. gravis str. ISS 4749]OWN53672.1 hypothetical protein AY512_05025 [Corynebacterium diphtheriae bv. gravis]OWO09606.1 hypothetical protein AY532_02965 [Corynebacterium diphtheriae bv. gravis]